MRDHTITLYKFDELPTDAAKETARNWMRQGVGEDKLLLPSARLTMPRSPQGLRLSGRQHLLPWLQFARRRRVLHWQFLRQRLRQ